MLTKVENHCFNVRKLVGVSLAPVHINISVLFTRCVLQTVPTGGTIPSQTVSIGMRCVVAHNINTLSTMPLTCDS